MLMPRPRPRPRGQGQGVSVREMPCWTQAKLVRFLQTEHVVSCYIKLDTTSPSWAKANDTSTRFKDAATVWVEEMHISYHENTLGSCGR